MNQNEGLSQKYNDSRFIAYKLSLFDVLSLPTQDYNILWKDKVVGRVNVIGTVVSIQKKERYNNVLLDDGTGNMCIRLFGGDCPEVSVGEIIQMIGRPRVFGQERYLAPEIITKIDNPAWLTARMREREILEGRYSRPNIEPQKKENATIERCLEMIKQQDSGEGVDVEVLLAHAIPEELIHDLLKGGAIFETRPGKVKLLD